MNAFLDSFQTTTHLSNTPHKPLLHYHTRYLSCYIFSVQNESPIYRFSGYIILKGRTPGPNSDRRRKDCITNGFGSQNLFIRHRRLFKDQFREIVNQLQVSVGDMVQEQIMLIEADLRMLKDKNAISKSERNPDFRNRVQEELERVRVEVEGIGRVLEGVGNAMADTERVR